MAFSPDTHSQESPLMEIAASIVVVIVAGLFAAMAVAPIVAGLPANSHRKRRPLTLTDTSPRHAEAVDRSKAA